MAKRPPAVKEAEIERALREAVLLRGGICVKVAAAGTRGFFDRLIVLPGARVIFAEVKKPKGGRVSVHQRQYHREFIALGVVVALVRTLEDIERLLSPP